MFANVLQDLTQSFSERAVFGCAGTVEPSGANKQRTCLRDFADQYAHGGDEIPLSVELVIGGTPTDTCMREES